MSDWRLQCSHVQILVKLTSPKNFHLQGKWSHKAQNIPSRRILFYQFFLGNSSAIFICVCPRANFLWFLFSWFEILGQAKKKVWKIQFTHRGFLPWKENLLNEQIIASHSQRCWNFGTIYFVSCETEEIRFSLFWSQSKLAKIDNYIKISSK